MRLPPRAPARSLSCSFSLPLTSSLIASVWIASFAAPAAGADDGTAARVAAALGTERFRLSDLGAASVAGGPSFDLVVSGPDGDVAFALAPRSLRAPHFRVFASGADGVEEVAPPPVATYRGVAYLEGVAEPAPAAASVTEGGVTALILLPDGSTRVVQPAKDLVDEAAPGLHVVYDSKDVAAPDLRCATEAILGPPPKDASSGSGGPLPVALDAAELAIEADLTFFQSNGTVEATVTNVETLLNAVTMIYETDAAITYLVTAIVVQTGPEEVYGSNKAGKLLDQFRERWNDDFDFVDRDTAHLLHGKALTSNIAGLAYVGVVCDEDVAYGWSRTTITGLFAFRVAITAHELGHNWNATHCDGDPDCEIMCSTIGSSDACTGGTSTFGQKPRQQIAKHLKGSSCIAPLPDPLAPPFHDPFDALEETHWLVTTGAKATKKAVGETSGEKALGLDLGDELRSNVIDLSGLVQARLEMFVAARGPEEGEELLVEGLTGGGAWMELLRVAADGTPDDSFAFHAEDLPNELLHAGFQLRMRPLVDEKNDDFYVDDVRVFDPGLGTLSSLRASAIEPIVVSYLISTPGGPDDREISIQNDGRTTAVLPWTATEVVDAPWLSLSPGSGILVVSEDEDVVTASFDSAGLPAFRHLATVRLANGSDTADVVDVPVAFVVHVGDLVAAGDTVTGTIEALGETDVFTFTGAAGDVVQFVAAPATSGLKPRLTIHDPLAAPFATVDFKGKKKQKKALTLTQDGEYIVEVGAQALDQAGDYSITLKRKTQKNGQLEVKRRKPATPGGSIDLPVTLQDGSSFSVTVVPVMAGDGPFTITVDDPDGTPVDVEAFVRALPTGGVQLHRLPIVRPGTVTVHVGGFAAQEKVDVTIDPGAPPEAAEVHALP